MAFKSGSIVKNIETVYGEVVEYNPQLTNQEPTKNPGKSGPPGQRIGEKVEIPPGFTGEVLDSDDITTVALYPIHHGGELEPRLIKVTDFTSSFKAAVRHHPFVWVPGGQRDLKNPGRPKSSGRYGEWDKLKGELDRKYDAKEISDDQYTDLVAQLQAMANEEALAKDNAFYETLQDRALVDGVEYENLSPTEKGQIEQRYFRDQEEKRNRHKKIIDRWKPMTSAWVTPYDSGAPDNEAKRLYHLQRQLVQDSIDGKVSNEEYSILWQQIEDAKEEAHKDFWENFHNQGPSYENRGERHQNTLNRWEIQSSDGPTYDEINRQLKEEKKRKMMQEYKPEFKTYQKPGINIPGEDRIQTHEDKQAEWIARPPEGQELEVSLDTPEDVHAFLQDWEEDKLYNWLDTPHDPWSISKDWLSLFNKLKKSDNFNGDWVDKTDIDSLYQLARKLKEVPGFVMAAEEWAQPIQDEWNKYYESPVEQPEDWDEDKQGGFWESEEREKMELQQEEWDISQSPMMSAVNEVYKLINPHWFGHGTGYINPKLGNIMEDQEDEWYVDEMERLILAGNPKDVWDYLSSIKLSPQQISNMEVVARVFENTGRPSLALAMLDSYKDLGSVVTDQNYRRRKRLEETNADVRDEDSGRLKWSATYDPAIYRAISKAADRAHLYWPNKIVNPQQDKYIPRFKGDPNPEVIPGARHPDHDKLVVSYIRSVQRLRKIIAAAYIDPVFKKKWLGELDEAFETEDGQYGTKPDLDWATYGINVEADQIARGAYFEDHTGERTEKYVKQKRHDEIGDKWNIGERDDSGKLKWSSALSDRLYSSIITLMNHLYTFKKPTDSVPNLTEARNTAYELIHLLYSIYDDESPNKVAWSELSLAQEVLDIEQEDVVHCFDHFFKSIRETSWGPELLEDLDVMKGQGSYDEQERVKRHDKLMNKWAMFKEAKIEFIPIADAEDIYNIVWNGKYIATLDAWLEGSGGTYISYFVVKPDAPKNVLISILRAIGERFPAPFRTNFENSQLLRMIQKIAPEALSDKSTFKGYDPKGAFGIGQVPIRDFNDTMLGTGMMDPSERNLKRLRPRKSAYKQDDPLDEPGLRAVIEEQEVQWWKMPREKEEQAVANALRVGMLSPLKLLKFNAVHYQDISKIPGDETDPQVYIDQLKQMKSKWDARGQTNLFDEPEEVDPFDSKNSEAYAGFIHKHLAFVANASAHITELTDAAEEDMRQGGKGFIWRDAINKINLPGVNSKVAAFAWLLLAPKTSELVTIDSHMMRALEADKGMSQNPKGYEQLEKEVRAAKDASGYSHMPAGMYQWGVWDYLRTPPDDDGYHHQSHAAMKVLDPLPYKNVKWHKAINNSPIYGERGPRDDLDWWHMTKDQRMKLRAEYELLNKKRPVTPLSEPEITEQTLFA